MRDANPLALRHTMYSHRHSPAKVFQRAEERADKELSRRTVLECSPDGIRPERGTVPGRAGHEPRPVPTLPPRWRQTASDSITPTQWSALSSPAANWARIPNTESEKPPTLQAPRGTVTVRVAKPARLATFTVYSHRHSPAKLQTIQRTKSSRLGCAETSNGVVPTAFDSKVCFGEGGQRAEARAHPPTVLASNRQ